MRIVTEPVPKGRLLLDLDPIDTVDQFHRVVELIVENFSATVKDQLEGPDACKTVLDVEGYELSLEYYSSLGNRIFAEDAEALPVLKRIKDFFEHLLA